MKLSKQDLSGWYTCNNFVLLKPIVDTTKFKYGTVEFYSPISQADGKPWNPYSSQPIVCQVIALPKKLVYGKKWRYVTSEHSLDLPPEQIKHLATLGREPKYTETELLNMPVPASMPWKTTLDLKQGDIVWCSANALMMCEKLNRTIEADGELFHLISYENIYLRKNGNDVVMLNGYALLSPVVKTDEYRESMAKKGIIIPEFKHKDDLPDRLAEIKYLGEPIEEYLDENRIDDDIYSVGDTVLLSFSINRRLEPGAKFFNGDDDFIVQRRCHFTAIFHEPINS